MCGTFWILDRCLFPSLFISIRKKALLCIELYKKKWGKICWDNGWRVQQFWVSWWRNAHVGSQKSGGVVSLWNLISIHFGESGRRSPAFGWAFLMSGGGIIIHCPNWQACSEYMQARFKIVFRAPNNHSEFSTCAGRQSFRMARLFQTGLHRQIIVSSTTSRSFWRNKKSR